MPLTVKELIEELNRLPEKAIILDNENKDCAIAHITYDEKLDECIVTFDEFEEQS